MQINIKKTVLITILSAGIYWFYLLQRGKTLSRKNVLGRTVNCISWWSSCSRALGSIQSAFHCHYFLNHLTNTSILQTFVNKVIDNKLGEDDKDKRVNSKCLAFIRRIDNKEMVFGLLVDQSVVWVVVHDWSPFGVDTVTCLGGSISVLRCRNWSGDAGIVCRPAKREAGLVQEELVSCWKNWSVVKK